MKADIKCPKCKGQIVWCHSGTDLWCGTCRLVIKNKLIDKAYLAGYESGRRQFQTEIKNLLEF